MSTAARLVPLLRQRRLTVLAGAGISAVAPSCLPSWWQLNHAVLDALARVGSRATATATDITAGIKAKQDAGRMPPEYTSEVISDTLGGDFFEVLRVVEGTRTNAVHRTLAALGKAGRLPAIVTTNFDTLIEQAFAQLDAPLKVLVRPEDYAGVDVAGTVSDPHTPTLLVKLHGTATDPSTTLETLAQRKRGFPATVGLFLRELLTHTHWCALGYSGADLDADPNYLYLRQMAARNTPGLHWLFRTGSQPNRAVQDVMEAYGDGRGALIYGELPQWLEPWEQALTGTGVAPPPAPPTVDVDQVRAEGAQRLSAAASDWANRLGPGPCGLVITNLAEEATPQLIEPAARQTLHWIAEHSPRSRHHGIAWMALGRRLNHVGRLAEATDAYSECVGIFQALDAHDAYAHALNEHANLLSTLGHLPQAAATLRESIRILQEIGDPDGVAIPRINLAHILARQGDVQAGLTEAARGMQEAIRQGDESSRALALEHVANLRRDIGETELALEHMQEAEGIRRRLGQDLALGYTLTHQATIHIGAAEFDRAVALLREAETLARGMGSPSLLATVQMTQAGWLSTRGDYPGAIRLLREAAQSRNVAGDPIGSLEVVGNIVGMLAAQGRADEAIHEGQAALLEANELGVPAQEATIRGNLGLAYEMRGDLDQAVAHYERSLELARDIREPTIQMNALGNLGNVHYRRSEMSEAVDAYERSVALARDAGALDILVRNYGNLGNAYAQTGSNEQAVASYQAGLTLAAENGLEGITGHLELNLAFVWMRQQNWPDAATRLVQAHRLLGAQGDNANAGLAAFYGAQCLAQGQEMEEARTLLAQSLVLWEGLDHPHEADARSWLARLGQS